MSNKTPKELADLYCKDFDPHDYGITHIAELLHSTYLIALEAGARMGYESGELSVICCGLDDDCGDEIQSFEEWWKKLEGEKSST
jgi:hypothetical protein